jgi:hypothetical protein
MAKLTGVSDSVFEAAGLPTAGNNNFISIPSLYKGQPALVFNGKPGVLYIGAEFCPYCAAERWALIVAFSKFGSFSNLHETTSSPWDTDPATPTFSFHKSSYSSSYVAFVPKEYESNDTGPSGAGRTVLESLTSKESNLWSKYETHFGESEGFPFVDIGNKVFVTGPSYDPSTLSGMNQSEIADNLTNPKNAITENIVGTANYLIAGICSITKDQPSSVCSMPIVAKASNSLGLS